MALLDDVKTGLRISDTAYDGEVLDLIYAARQDMIISGVSTEKAYEDTDPLIKRAITVYAKAHFGWNNPDAEKLEKAYVLLKQHLSLSSEYKG